MAANRKGPRVIQEIHRLKSMGLGKKTVAKTLGISKNTVKEYWDLASAPAQTTTADGSAVQAKTLTPLPRYEAPWSKQMDWQSVKQAVDEGTALSNWLEEHLESVGSESPLRAVSYNSFWREFKRRYPDAPLEFHKYHPPGERTEIDYKGSRPGFGYWDLKTGEFIACELFGAVLCFSQLLYVEATATQKKADFLGSIHRCFSYFGGVTPILTGDNLKSAVTKADRYDPELNTDFSAFCAHYGTAPIPARPRKPKDKNLIEGALGIFWRWLRPKIAKQRFYSMGELNVFVREMVEKFNHRVQRKYGLSRRQKFESAEKPLLKPMPDQAYEICEWKRAKLHWDCFAQVGKNFYSAPYSLRGKELEVRITPQAIEFYYQLERVAVHRYPGANQQGRYFRQDEHLPPAHQAILEMVPQNCLKEAKRIGPETHLLVERLITQAPHPLMYLRRSLGVLRLKSRYSADQLERASRLANSLPEKLPRLTTLEGILKSQAAQATNVVEMPAVKRRPNPHLRGPEHWMQTVPPQNLS